MERVELKDVRVPEQLMRAMAAEAEAAREARAKVIAAEGEHKASRALRHAAEVIDESPAALQVKTINWIMNLPCTAAEISASSQPYFSREQQHGGVPRPCRRLLLLPPEEQGQSGKLEIYHIKLYFCRDHSPAQIK